MRKLTIVIVSSLFLYSCASSPNGLLTGYIKDSATSSGIGSADIDAYQGTVLKASVTSANAETHPIHGYYQASLPIGDYEIRVAHSGYATSTANYVSIDSPSPAVERDIYLKRSSCQDGDGDGFGLPAAQACPKGAVADCNDSNAHIYPGGPELRVSGAQDTFYPISSLQSVFSNTETGKTIQSKIGTFTGNLKIDQDKSIAIAGGYDCNFSTISGSTVVHGDVTINKGLLTIDSGILSIEP